MIPVVRPRPPAPAARPESAVSRSAGEPVRHEERRPAPPRERAAPAPPAADRTTVVPKASLVPGAPAVRYVVGWLLGINGSLKGESFAVRIGRNVIGRDSRSDIPVSDDQASSHHADLVFRLDEKRYILMDHNSTNGTFVNETEIEPRRDLAKHDVVRIGTHDFLFIPLEGFSWDEQGNKK